MVVLVAVSSDDSEDLCMKCRRPFLGKHQHGPRPPPHSKSILHSHKHCMATLLPGRHLMPANTHLLPGVMWTQQMRPTVMPGVRIAQLVAEQASHHGTRVRPYSIGKPWPPSNFSLYTVSEAAGQRYLRRKLSHAVNQKIHRRQSDRPNGDSARYLHPKEEKTTR
jgi:hypothetical protein